MSKFDDTSFLVMALFVLGVYILTTGSNVGWFFVLLALLRLLTQK